MIVKKKKKIARERDSIVKENFFILFKKKTIYLYINIIERMMTVK